MDRRYSLITDHPIAIHSLDHLDPHGTAHDNSKSEGFCRNIEAFFGRKVSLLDLGCAGGGLVAQMVSFWHDSVGLEGSDFSKLHCRAEWGVVPDRLFTCDCGKPFRVKKDGQDAHFDVVTAWEVCEHVPEGDLPTFLANVRDHLAPDGIFVATIPYDRLDGSKNTEKWHVTWKPRAWWDGLFLDGGFAPHGEAFGVVSRAQVRGEPETLHVYRRAG